MSEIGTIVSDVIDYDPDFVPNLNNWKKTGQTALVTFSFIATCAFIPALCKKKRVITPTLGFIAPVVIEMAATEPPQNGIEKAPIAIESHQAKIREIFSITGTEGLGTTISNAWYLWKLRKEILDVHPFEFLRVAPKEKVRFILQEKKSLKVKGVLGGVTEGMERELAKNNINRYLQGFAADMGKDPEQLKMFIEHRNWQGMVEYLYL